MRCTARALGIVTSIVLMLVALHAYPVSGQDEATELNKKTQNPVADLISVPLQHNFYFDTGPKDAAVYVLNVQPIIPFHLTQNWNLIARVIVPVINQPSLFPGAESAFGLGDINPTLLLTPAKPGALIWGVGPTFTFPTATDEVLGSAKWIMGPSVVGLMKQGPWLFGATVKHEWSFAGWGKKDVSLTTISPFLNYNLGRGLAVGTLPVITADWEADSRDRWTVPVGLGVSQVLKLGPLPVKFALSGYYNAQRPRFGSDWQLLFTTTFLFPR